MNIRNIKTWFTKSATSENNLLNLQIEYINMSLQSYVVEDLRGRVCRLLADEFMKKHGEELEKQILNDHNFADSVYNAIVLKKAKEVL